MNYFREGLDERGYIDGRNIVVEFRFADGDPTRLYEMAAELASTDAIVLADTAAITAARQTTQTTPLIMTVASDPVGTGTVQSIARPGGNITGLGTLSVEVMEKRLGYLRDTIPGLATIAVLWQRTGVSPLEWEKLETAAVNLDISLTSHEIQDQSEIDGAVARAAESGARAMLVLATPMIQTNAPRIVSLARERELPVMGTTPEWVTAGALMAYAPPYPYIYNRAADFVDRIIKGSNPAEMPIELPVKFDFIVNTAAMTDFGLTLPERVKSDVTQTVSYAREDPPFTACQSD